MDGSTQRTEDTADATEGAFLAGRRILVVDDESLIAMGIESILSECGGAVSTASTAANALKELDAAKFDAVLLDVHLDEGDSYGVADELRRRQIPFAFLSGYLTIREAYADAPFLAKPYERANLLSALQLLLS